MKLFKNEKGFGLIEGLLTIIALCLIIGVGYYVYHSQKKDTPSNNTASTSSITPSSESQQKPLPELVDYGKDGIKVNKKSDISKLYNTSDSFKSFIASKLPQNEAKNTDLSAACYEDQGFIVRKIYKDEVALGDILCSGYVIWQKNDSGWKQLVVSQETLLCSYVDEHNIPHQIADKCTDPSLSADSNGNQFRKNPN